MDPDLTFPPHFSSCSPQLLVNMISCLFDKKCRSQVALVSPPQNLRVFYCEKAPDISFLDYLNRILKYIDPPQSLLLASLLIMLRFESSQPLFLICSLTVHRTFLSSLVISYYCYSDVFYENPFYAKVGGISSKELISLLVSLLSLTEQPVFDIEEQSLSELYLSLIEIYKTSI